MGGPMSEPDDPVPDPDVVAASRANARVTQVELDPHRSQQARPSGNLAAQIQEGAASAELFRLLVASVHDYAIFMLDPDGRVMTWNAGAERIKGYAAGEIIGRPFSTFYPREDVDAGKCELELELATRDGRFEDEGWRVRKDGERFWANVVISAVLDAAGQLVGFAKVTRDLTERRRVDEERAARLVAEQANRAKDEFLAMLGHELRNPLAPIITALELIRRRGEDPLAREHLIIQRQIQHMTHLIDDLLDVSRITQDKLEIRQDVLSLGDLVGRALEIASPLLAEHGHHLALEVPEAALRVRGEEARLIQVFSNLIVNAAKYTPPGGHIAVRVRPAGPEVLVEVSDDGVGISAELLPRVFDVFVQGPQGLARSAGGLGLGLALVHRLIALHGGRVEVHSAGPAMGSTFTVRLPCVERAAPEALESAEVLAPALARSHRILVVDDNEDARELLAELLATYGHAVESIGDPIVALERARTFGPDVAILDLGLPEMDGDELGARLRAERPDAHLRLIALTGYGQPSDIARTTAAGFDAHLLKPVDLPQLLRVLSPPAA